MTMCLRWAAAAVLVTVAGWAQAQPLQTPSSGPAPNLVARAARELGVVTCLAAVDRLSSVAIAGSRNHDVLIDWDRAQPDSGPFFSLSGINFAGQSIAATITAIPDTNKGCTVAAERISVAPFTCQSIAEVELKGYTATPLLPTFTVYSSPQDPGSSVSLIDSPPSCLVIRRLVRYGWKDSAAASPTGR
jgi:hypothetical protein